MRTIRPSEDSSTRTLPQAAALVLLVLAAVAMVFLALQAPEINVELPVTPRITDYPIPIPGGL
jgi:hypothetical protein